MSPFRSPLASLSRCLSLSMNLLLAQSVASAENAVQPDNDAAIERLAEAMQRGWNDKDGARSPRSSLPSTITSNIRGSFIPDATREGNARVHQQLFDSVYKDVDIQLRVAEPVFSRPTPSSCTCKAARTRKGLRTSRDRRSSSPV